MHFAQQCSWDRFNTRGYSFGGQPEAKNMTLSSICNALATTRARGLPLWCMQQLFAASPSSVAVVQRTHSAARTYSAASQGEASNEVVPSAYSDYEQHDVCIVGGGIVGLATAREIINRYPKLTVCVLEKEKAVATHQTNHNSGVIHAGIYYEPGSTMARCCVSGAEKIYEYCAANSIPCERVGKIIVATSEAEVPILHELQARGTANGVEGLEVISGEKVRELEPNIHVTAGLLSPNTGIADYAAVARSFASEVQNSGRGTVHLSFEAKEFTPTTIRTVNPAQTEESVSEPGVIVSGVAPGQKGPKKHIKCRFLITCCGLQSDRVAVAAGGDSKPKVLPFRGTYYQMKPEYKNIVTRNIYPIPGGGGIPVGVHFTPTVHTERGQQMIIGPGACLAFSREGYSFFDLSFRDMVSTLTHRGLWSFAIRFPQLSLGELYKDLNKAAFIAEAQKMAPGLTLDQCEESFAGVMAQVFDDNGNAAKDFIFERKLLNGTTLHVRNAPTPACTASMAIAEDICDAAAEDFAWKNL